MQYFTAFLNTPYVPVNLIGSVINTQVDFEESRVTQKASELLESVHYLVKEDSALELVRLRPPPLDNELCVTSSLYKTCRCFLSRELPPDFW